MSSPHIRWFYLSKDWLRRALSPNDPIPVPTFFCLIRLTAKNRTVCAALNGNSSLMKGKFGFGSFGRNSGMAQHKQEYETVQSNNQNNRDTNGGSSYQNTSSGGGGQGGGQETYDIPVGTQRIQ